MTIYGVLGVNDNDRSLINQVGQTVVFDAASEYLRAASEDLDRFVAIFAQETTENYTERYRLPGSGRLQRRGGQAQSGAVKPYGSWDVAYPLEDFGAQLAMTDVDRAYTTLQHLQNHLETIRVQDLNTVRHEMLYALFNNVARTFTDPNYGNLSIQPLANADAVLYPPVLGSEAAAAEGHYLASGYTAANISDTNNPYATIRNELEEHFGTPSGFGNTVAFINTAQIAKTEALTDFDPVPDMHVTPGADRDVPTGMPTVPGRVIGRANGVWIVEWRWVPANYILAMDLDQPRPLKMRVDPVATGLGMGLQLVKVSDQNPFEGSHFRHRFGVGVGNRLNGVAMELTTDGSYDIPAAYA
jgi:hypothetical protein